MNKKPNHRTNMIGVGEVGYAMSCRLIWIRTTFIRPAVSTERRAMEWFEIY